VGVSIFIPLGFGIDLRSNAGSLSSGFGVYQVHKYIVRWVGFCPLVFVLSVGFKVFVSLGLMNLGCD